ncbi:ribokinase [Marinicrinis lubricantis]|uniref:Ribokinase n=1 Tax=Marinicrinis lubricantis TaxID=2086470 RepID=A0ABW1IJX4_9BACL
MIADIVVIGSLNMDMVVRVDRRPEQGETLLGRDFFMSPGGKGANQAYAAGKLGASVAMIGQLGEDLFAGQLLNNLSDARVETRYMEKVQGQSSGVALITIDSEGDNSIIVAPGANFSFTPATIRKYEEVIRQAKILMLQLEIPLECVMEAARIAKAHKVQILLDPAPAQPLPDELLCMVDYIVPNEAEIAQLTGIQVMDEPSAIEASLLLRNKGIGTVVSKLGDQGVVVTDASGSIFIPGMKVDAVDTTAAGDAFAGAFATALVEGRSLKDAAYFANAVGALTVTKPGAQASMPDRQLTESFIKALPR